MVGGDDIPKERYNVDHVFFDGRKKIYVFLNHRSALLCWVDALKKGIIGKDALLFHIDHHADFGLSSKDLLKEIDNIDLGEKKKLEEFVKTKLSVLNYDFIVLSMEIGVIGDVISVDEEHDNAIGIFRKGTYDTTDRHEIRTLDGTVHTFYHGGSTIANLVGYQSLLTDSCIHQDVKKIFSRNAQKKNIILDIDLDFFTYPKEGRRWAINEKNLQYMLDSEDFNYIFDNAVLVTIGLEPFFCGEIIECLSILKGMDLYFQRKMGLTIIPEVLKRFHDELPATTRLD